MATYAIRELATCAKGASILIGERAGTTISTSLSEVMPLLDQENRRPKEQWWMKFRPLMNALAIPSSICQPMEGCGK